MVSVQRLGHVAIRVQDMARAVAFYTGLGMRMVWEADDWCYLEAGEGRDGLACWGRTTRRLGPPLRVPLRDRAHVDVVHQQLKDQGVHVGAVHDHRDGTASFYFRDPEGNWLEMLYEPLEGFPPITRSLWHPTLDADPQPLCSPLACSCAPGNAGASGVASALRSSRQLCQHPAGTTGGEGHGAP